jgi:hypothetical protein
VGETLPIRAVRRLYALEAELIQEQVVGACTPGDVAKVRRAIVGGFLRCAVRIS